MSTLFKLPFLLTPQPEGGYTVTCPVLPELVTEGDTVEEALANVHDAVAAVRELYEDLGKPMPAMTVEPAQSPIWFEGLVTQP